MRLRQEAASRLHLALTIAAFAAFSSGCATLSPTAASAPRSEAVQTSTLPSVTYAYPRAGVAIGQGWDTFTESGTTATCVEAMPIPLESTSYATSVSQLQSSHSLMRSRSMSARASYKGAGAKASSSVSASYSTTLNTDALNFLFSFQAEAGSSFAAPPAVYEQLVGEPLRSALAGKAGAAAPRPKASELAALAREIRLTKEAQRLLAGGPEGLQRFRVRCGQGFVAAIHRGARLDLLLTTTSTDSSVRSALSVALSASGYGASGSASFRSTNETKDAIRELSFRAFQEGGIPFVPPAVRTGKDFDVAALIPPSNLLTANPTAFRVVVVPYENIEPVLTDKLPSPLRMMTVADYYVALKDLYALADNLVETVNRPGADYIHPRVSRAYGGGSELLAVKDQILIDLGIIELFLDKCYETMRACTIKEVMAALKAEDQGAMDESLAGAKMQLMAVNSARQSDLVKAAGDERWVRAGAANKVLVPAGSDAAKALKSGAPEASATPQVWGEGAQSTALQRFVEAVQRLNDMIRDGDVEEDFFLRFYWYLMRLPVPQQALEPYVKATDWNIVATSPIADRTARAEAIRSGLVQASFNFRLQPWKRFFCDNLKHEPLCVTDQALFELANAMTVKLTDADLVLVPPAPPPPPPPGKKRCKRILGICL